LWSDPGVRMNEGGCDPDGRFYSGSMAYDQSVGAASLYRLGPERFGRGGAGVFDDDTSARLINRRTFAELPDGGRPDGLAVDAGGGIWTAVSNGGAVYRYSAEGVLEEKLAVPARKVTACTFGGEHLDQLFITTSKENIDTREGPTGRVSVLRRRRGQRLSGHPLRRLMRPVRSHR
jgi:sugar lactone lactonase YvrE